MDLRRPPISQFIGQISDKPRYKMDAKLLKYSAPDRIRTCGRCLRRAKWFNLSSAASAVAGAVHSRTAALQYSRQLRASGLLAHWSRKSSAGIRYLTRRADRRRIDDVAGLIRNIVS